MLHLVYFALDNLSDPVVLTEAGTALLVSVLRSLLQNCLLLDFTDYRFDERIKVEVENLPHDVRKTVKTLLARLAKANRIVRALEDDYSGAAELELIGLQGRPMGLELVIIRREENWDAAAMRVPRASISEYAMTDFETRRSQGMSDQHFNDDAMAGQQFIDVYVVPFIRFSQRVDIIDGSLGWNYHDDYGYTLDCLLAAVRQSCHWTRRVQLAIHCRRGRGKMPDNVRQTITELARKHALDGQVEVRFYGDPSQPIHFKHDRCMVSELGVLNIGRGFDFIRKSNRQIRNTVVGFGGPDADTMLGPYANLRS